jgi:hypothetical protein
VKIKLPRSLWSGIVVTIIATGMALWPLPELTEVQAAPVVEAAVERVPDAALPVVLGSTAAGSQEVVQRINPHPQDKMATQRPNPSSDAVKVYFQN